MLIVKKFGGTSVGNKERIFNVAKRCIEEYQKGNDVVVVLSAMGKMTDELLSMAADINPKASKREMDMLLTTGEQTSVALAAMAVNALGVPAISLNAFQVKMHTDHRYGNARLKDIDTERIQHELEQRKIVFVTGFQGVDRYDNYTTLGRGGSDTTAVALAAVLNADACEIYTDVDGVYTADPRVVQEAYKLKEITKKEFMDWLDIADIDPTIKSLNERCYEIREDTLDYIYRKVNLNSKDKKLIDKMIASALKRLVREPILNLKQVKDKGKREEYIKLIEELFEI